MTRTRPGAVAAAGVLGAAAVGLGIAARKARHATAREDDRTPVPELPAPTSDCPRAVTHAEPVAPFELRHGWGDSVLGLLAVLITLLLGHRERES